MGKIGADFFSSFSVAQNKDFVITLFQEVTNLNTIRETGSHSK